MARSESVENAYETASATNGTARPTPNRTPPTAGPTSRTIERRPSSVLAAAASWAFGTTDLKTPERPALKKTLPVPSTKLTAMICQKASRPRRIAATRPLTAIVRTMSEAIISRFRSPRSPTTPATRLKSTIGRNCAKDTAPAFAGECVTASVSRGYAIDAMLDPIADSSCPLWKRTKSRLRRSGVRRSAIRRRMLTRCRCR